MAMRIQTPAVGPEKLLVNAWNLTASAVVYVRADCNKGSGPGTRSVDWRVLSDKASTMLAYKSRTIANTGTITLADATQVDDGDTFLLNGVTMTAEETEGDATGLKWWCKQADTTYDAISLAACINRNVPGVTATASARVVTVVPSGSYPAPTLLFQLAGAQAAAPTELAWVDNTLANLIKDGAFTSVTGAATNTTKGTLYQQYADGWPYVYLGYTDTSAAITALTIGATLHDSLG